MADDQTVASINDMAAEEQELREREAAGVVTDADRERIAELEVLLDQRWDLLRQRRARRDSAADPDDAHLRDTATVEGYQQ